MNYSKGDIIDGYKVSLPLGQGEGADTYRVRDTDGRLYVLKFGVSDAERFLLDRVGLLENQTGSYVIIRHIAGETLEMKLRRERTLCAEDINLVVTQVLAQLCECHTNGYVHNGLTPGHVMIDISCEPNKVWLTGYGGAVESDSFAGDCVALGKLIYRMQTGENPDGPLKIRVNATKEENRLNDLMIKALSGAFRTGMEMKSYMESDSVGDAARKPVGPGFSAVAGMEELKQRLRTDVIEILANKEEAARYGLTLPNGMLLYGPPGCGKTYIAERFAEEAAYNYQYVKSSDLASTYLHGSQEKIAELFNEARRNAPTILCFDEFDALVPKRDVINNASHSAEVNEFLSQLNNCGNDGVFVIATTNRPDKIDSAVLRSGRIDYKIYVPVPDFESRKALFQVMLKGRPSDDSIDYDRLAKNTDGYLASDIAAMVQMAAREAFRAKSDITQKLLVHAAKSMTPSLSKSQIKEYDRMRQEFEKKNDDGDRKHIGFL